MSVGKSLILLIVAAAVAAFFYLDLAQYLSFEAIKAQQASLQAKVDAQPVLSALVFFIVYVLAIAVSLPGAALLTLLGGALFGLWKGLLIVSFASTIGASLAFLATRYLFKDAVQNRWGDKLKVINDGVEKEGGFYLFGMRLVPAFPFFMINLVMAVTPIKLWTYYWVSQLGMLPGTFVYVNAGTQLSKLESAAGILSPGLILSFVLLGTFPFIAKKLLAFVKNKQN